MIQPKEENEKDAVPSDEIEVDCEDKDDKSKEENEKDTVSSEEIKVDCRDKDDSLMKKTKRMKSIKQK